MNALTPLLALIPAMLFLILASRKAHVVRRPGGTALYRTASVGLVVAIVAIVFFSAAGFGYGVGMDLWRQGSHSPSG